MSYKPLTKKEIVEILVQVDMALNPESYLGSNSAVSKGIAAELAEKFEVESSFIQERLANDYRGSDEEI